MRTFLLVILSFVLVAQVQAQEPDVRKLHETAKTFIRTGDYSNALMILERALQIEPKDLELLKDYAFTLYLKKDYARALEVAKPFAERKDVDVQAYQILAMVYKALEERKESEKLYKAALKKFPSSGALYNEFGEMLWAKKDFGEAVKQWEKGIETDPNYSGNYYNVAKYYYFSQDKWWGLIYGELFVNLESYSQRTVEIKGMLLEGYKKLFTGGDVLKGQDIKNEFVAAGLGLMQKHGNSIINSGITPETITILRSRFILDWYAQYATKFPFRLFEHHQQLQRMGLLDAYDQWIFGAAANLASYQQWTSTHAETNKEFLRLQQNRVFKIPAGQYYQTATK